jgi:hypothetical protein
MLKGVINHIFMNLEPYERRLYSQNGEDGILQKLIRLLYQDYTSKYYVEFGVENGSECNTRLLRELCGWTGLQMDGGNEQLHINLRQEKVIRENVVDLFRKYNVPKHINCLSVDIDYNDFYCLGKVLEHYTCDIIVCEYNASIPAHEDKVVPYDPNKTWDGTNYFGTSLLSLTKLCNHHDYTLVYCERCGVNAFFVRTELLHGRNVEILNMGNIDKLFKPVNYGGFLNPTAGLGTGHIHDHLNRQYITYDETRS